MFKDNEERLKQVIQNIKSNMEKFNGKKGILPNVKEMEEQYGVKFSMGEMKALKICMELELTPGEIEQLKVEMLWGTFGKSGKELFKAKRLIDCDTQHLENIMIMCTPSSALTKKIIIEILKDRYSGKAKEPTDE